MSKEGFKSINKSIKIQATKAKIWNKMLDLENYKKWAKFFSEGSQAETDWKEGSKVIFGDGGSFGMLGKIAEHVENQKLDIVYYGQILDGVEDTTSPEALLFADTHEIYDLLGEDGDVTLQISSEMTEKYYDSMSEAWDLALAKIKDMSENE